MRREPNYLLLGATVAVIVVLFVGVLIFLAGTSTWGRSYQTIQVKFSHDMPLPRLDSGAEVTCGGIPVGKIDRVDLKALPGEDPAGPADLCLVVQAKVDKTVELRKDCKIRAEAPPLGGSGTLTIVHRGYSTLKLSNDELVQGLSPSGLNAVVGQLGDKLAVELDDKNPQGLLRLVKGQLDTASSESLMSRINGIASDLLVVSGRMKQQLDPQQQGALLATLDGALSDIKTVTGSLREEANTQNPLAMFGRLNGILSALHQASQGAAGMVQDNRPTVQTALSNVQDTTAIIKGSFMPSLLAQLDAAEQTSLMSKFHAAADKTNATLSNLQDMTGSVRNLVLVNQDSLESTILNLQETSEHLRGASREIRRNPWRLLYQPKPGEVKQVAVADAARSFSDAAGKLDSSFARLEAYVRNAGPSLPADDPQLKQFQAELGLSLKNLTESEKKFWELFAGQK